MLSGKQVILFNFGLRFGGTERNTIFIARELYKRGYNVEICSCSNKNPLLSILKNSKVPVKIIPVKYFPGKNYLGINYLYNPLELAKLFLYIYKNRGAVLQFFGFPLIWIGGVFSIIAGAKKVITTIQDQDVWKKNYHIMLDRIVYKGVHKIICDGGKCKQFAIDQAKTDASKFVTIYDGVDLEGIKVDADLAETRKSLGLEPTNPVIGVIARLDVKKKGQDVFLKAAAKVLAAYPSVKILLVGDGEDRFLLEDLAKELKLEQHTIFAGFRTDLANMLALIDILVIPSNWESVPKILLEAMALAKPIISTNVDDIPEIVEDRKTAILIPPGDEVAMAAAITELLSSPQKRIKMGHAARKKILREFTIEKSIEQLEYIYSPLFQQVY